MAWSTDRVRIGFGSAVPGIAFIFSVAVVLLLFSPLGFAQHTYYISKTLGNDSNTSTQAQSKSTPWQHLPGTINGCTTGCATPAGWGCGSCKGPGNGYGPVAGDQFILYGGDTWTNADLGIEWDGNGTGQCLTTPNSSCMYIGVDQTWYNSRVCGSSWCRPIFNAEGTVLSPQTTMLYIWGNYITVDNIELKGFATSGGSGGNMVQIANNGSVAEHMYLHGWSHAARGDTDNANVFGFGGGNSTTGSCAHDNVVDGSDTSQDMMAGFLGTVPCAYNNMVSYVTNGFEATGSNWHDNWVGPIMQCYSGCHQNGIFNFGPDNGATSMFIYNNVITHVQLPGGGGGLWLSGLVANTATGYAFNNVMYNNDSGFSLDLAGHDAVNYGAWYFFNNTMECGTDSSLSTGAGSCGNDSGGTSGMTFVFHAINNHFIKGDTTAPIGCTYSTCTFTTQLTQTLSAANSQGYNDNNPPSLPTSDTYFAFSPASGCTSSTCSTVQAGTNEQSLCTTIARLNVAAGTACQSDTGYACTYNTSNHTLSCPDRTENTRPQSGAWDIGAYLYNGDPPPNPPTGLTAVVK
jgi:hypothetical protein